MIIINEPTFSSNISDLFEICFRARLQLANQKFEYNTGIHISSLVL